MNQIVRLLGILFLGAALMVSSAAQGEETDAPRRHGASQHVMQATRLFDNGKYQAAIKEYRAAYQQEPLPMLLYSIGVCYQRLGNPAEALGFYALYLQKEPKPREDIVKNLEGLLEQTKNLTTEAQQKKQEVLARLCAFGSSPNLCPKRSPMPPEELENPASRAGSTATAPGTAVAKGSQTPLGSGEADTTTPNERPLYRKGWFWGVLAGAVMVAGVAIGVGVYVGTRPTDVPDPTGIKIFAVQF